MSQQQPSNSTRPYLIRALHEWCADNGFTPFVTVLVDRSVQVPMEFVKDGEIVLNIGFEATTGLRLGNDFMEFKARFGGVVRGWCSFFRPGWRWALPFHQGGKLFGIQGFNF